MKFPEFPKRFVRHRKGRSPGIFCQRDHLGCATLLSFHGPQVKKKKEHLIIVAAIYTVVFQVYVFFCFFDVTFSLGILEISLSDQI